MNHPQIMIHLLEGMPLDNKQQEIFYVSEYLLQINHNRSFKGEKKTINKETQIVNKHFSDKTQAATWNSDAP